ncbi:MAG: hypothetical protein HC826_01555 [Rhodospirillales bacterium]|nr:hypothetical protein [Rhodospirillales bacterium]
MVPGFGFLLNNELTDFNLRPRWDEQRGDPGANDVAAGKRPRSSITPAILFADPGRFQRPIAALGSPGGPTIPNTVLNVILNLVDHRMPLQDAIAAPRISLTSPDDRAETRVEAGFSTDVLARLRATCSPGVEPPACYRFREVGEMGSIQAVVVDPVDDRRYGGADGRREGTVLTPP